jgi:bis(5'-nucleosyl)-tetraphosphatase (symmetrical)
VKGQGNRQVTVLGNHDLAMLVVARMASGRRIAAIPFGDVLSAPDRDELLAWLRHQKLMHAADGWAMVHAGFSRRSGHRAGAGALPGEVRGSAAGAAHVEFLKEMLRQRAARLARGPRRLRPVAHHRERHDGGCGLVAPGGTLELDHKLGPDPTRRRRYTPWYDHPGAREPRHTSIVSGTGPRSGCLLRDEWYASTAGACGDGALRAAPGGPALTDCDCSELAGKALAEDDKKPHFASYHNVVPKLSLNR